MDIFTLIPSLTPAEWCQSCFILGSIVTVSVAVLPAAPGRLMLQYGARAAEEEKQKIREECSLEKFVSWITSRTQIPHSWFGSFYATSLLCSFFWAYQYAVDGRVLRYIASRQAEGRPSVHVQNLQAVAVAWFLMVIQGSRRLYEQRFVARPSKSTMWVIHWLMGMIFYPCVSVSIWVEGSESILSHRHQVSGVHMTPSAGRVLGIVMFFVGSVAQNRCHRHLASLKKYSLPTEGLFHYIICPHYTCECLLYLGLSFVAASDGQLVSRTVLCGMIFAATNLGVTAHGTRKWYEQKFGAEKLASRSTMLPLVY